MKILNETLNPLPEFGRVSEGNTFEFEMPDESVTVTAQFVATDKTDFAMDTVGASVHKVIDENGVVVEDAYDGIRYLTRLNLKNGFDPKGGQLTVTYDGKVYKVKEMGSLLKRVGNEMELNYANAKAHMETKGQNRMWVSEAYTQNGNYLLVDYTEGYIDFAVVMMTEYTDREYIARGYMLLENVENAEDVVEVLSETTLRDSVNSAKARL